MPLFAAIEAACKGISMLVQRAAIAGATGVATGGGENAGGDQQKKLDVVSNDLLKGFLARSGVVRVLASEEVYRLHRITFRARACVYVLYGSTVVHPLSCTWLKNPSRREPPEDPFAPFFLRMWAECSLGNDIQTLIPKSNKLSGAASVASHRSNRNFWLYLRFDCWPC